MRVNQIISIGPSHTPGMLPVHHSYSDLNGGSLRNTLFSGWYTKRDLLDLIREYILDVVSLKVSGLKASQPLFLLWLESTRERCNF